MRGAVISEVFDMNNVVILAGGQGKRMKTNKPKVLLEVLGEPMLEWVISACEDAGMDRVCVVKGFECEQIDEYLSARESKVDIRTALQAERLGTGHAVMQAVDFLKEDTSGNTLILCGDAPFIDAETIRGALEHHEKSSAAVTVVTSEIDEPKGYGRILRTDNGISGIREEKDCSDEERLIKEINSGCYWFRTEALLEALPELKQNNAQGEYYLTDCIEILLSKGEKADAFMSGNEQVALGANDRKGLLALNDIARKMVIDKWLDEGVEFVCTDGVSIGRRVTVGVGTRIDSNVKIRGKSVIGRDCRIGVGCIIEDSVIGDGVDLNYVQAYSAQVDDNAKIGPFVQLRPDSHVKKGAKIGDFVEIKNSTIGEYTAVAHLTYVGDSDVGKNVNFGCGVVTVNFDGEKKYRTTIGDNAFIGCNTNLVSPVNIGDGAYTGAGSTITKDVPAGALALERTEQKIIEGYAEKKLKARTEKFVKAHGDE